MRNWNKKGKTWKKKKRKVDFGCLLTEKETDSLLLLFHKTWHTCQCITLTINISNFLYVKIIKSRYYESIYWDESKKIQTWLYFSLRKNHKTRPKESVNSAKVKPCYLFWNEGGIYIYIYIERERERERWCFPTKKPLAFSFKMIFSKNASQQKKLKEIINNHLDIKY